MSGAEELFVEGRADSFMMDMDAVVGRIEVRASREAECHARWGGWDWSAEGSDRDTALRRLQAWLDRLNPFDGFDTDWGEPGHKADELSEHLTEGMRTLMEEWEQFRDARDMQLIGKANDLVLRSRDFERTLRGQ